MPAHRPHGCGRSGGSSFDETRCRLAICHHHDLFHVFPLRLQDASRQPQSLGRVSVIRPNLRGDELGQRQLLSSVVKQHDLQRVAWILRADQVTEGERDFLRRCETVFAIENHRMRAIEHDHCGAGRLIIALMHVQVLVFQVQRNLEAFALNRRQQRRVHVKIDRIAEFVRFTGGFGFHACGEMQSIVAPNRTLAQTSEQIAQRFITEKIQPLLSDFKLDVPRQRLFDSPFAVAAHHFPPLLGLRFLV